MCGIVGAVGQRNVVSILIEGLKRLEYRGYDSTGLGLVGATGLTCLRSIKRVADLDAQAASQGVAAGTGIAHTRWATHGAPAIGNAHPHTSNRNGEVISIVHNGIIENHKALRLRLARNDYAFASETDSEVIAHLVHWHKSQGKTLLEAVRCAVSELKGLYAIAVVDGHDPDRVVGAYHGAPLLVGVGEGEMFLASDVFALLPVTRTAAYLEDGDVVEIRRDGYTVLDAAGRRVRREERESAMVLADATLGTYEHFMQKEIFEQPDAVAATLQESLDSGSLGPEIFGERGRSVLSGIEGVLILACGTSYHAGLIARHWLEELAQVPVSVEVASEFRYRKSCLRPNTLVVAISQSGETADTIAALRHAKAISDARSLTICNAPESALMRMSDACFITRAGPEIGVASTKTFTTQLVALFLLALVIAKFRGRLPSALEHEHLQALRRLPAGMSKVLEVEQPVITWAGRLVGKHHTLFVGRGIHAPIALEGALKLKEITYIHAEGFPAGELKHGPLALVDADTPIVAVTPNDQLLEKLHSNLHEVRARGGELYVFADHGAKVDPAIGLHVMRLTDHAGPLSPVLHVIPLQLLAYHVARILGTDIDKPRNLAKSVTVE